MSRLGASDLILGAALASLGAYSLFWRIPNYIAPVTDRPAVFPAVISLALLIIGILQASGAILQVSSRSPASHANRRKYKSILRQPQTIRSAISYLVLLSFIWLMPILGFSVSAGIIVAALFATFGVKNMKAIFIASILIALFVHLLFDIWLGIPLPKGLVLS